MVCKIVFYTVSIDSSGRTVGYAGSHLSSGVRSICETHGMDMGSGPVGTGDFCPIGRIEKATEEALAKIKSATEGK